MIVVNRKNDRITGAIEGRPFNVAFDQELYDTLGILSSRLNACKDRATYNSIVEESDKLIIVDFKEEVAAANGYLKYRKNTGKYYLVVNKGTNKEKVSSIPLPEVLSLRIIESYETGSNYMPLLLTWQRFLAKQLILPEFKQQNLDLFANYITAEFVDHEKVIKLMEDEGLTEEAALSLSTFSDIAISNFGMLVTYKVVDVVKQIWKLEKDKDGNEIRVKVDAFPGTTSIDEVTGEVTKISGKPTFLEELTFTPAIYKNGDNFFCGNDLGYKYKIGQVHTLPEDAKRNHENTFGGGGLYAGGQAYIQGYSNERTETLTCFIDPFDIISFQDDGRAFRTDRMFINGSLIEEGELEGMYFESQYAKESDANIKKNFTKVVMAKTALMEESHAEMSELTSFIPDNDCNESDDDQ